MGDLQTRECQRAPKELFEGKRGYENLVKKLRQVCADIKIIDEN